MSGTIEGGLKAAATTKQRYGVNFHRDSGRKGGKQHRGPRWWALHPDAARQASYLSSQARRQKARTGTGD